MTVRAVAGALGVLALIGLAPGAAGAAPGERRLTGTVTSDQGTPIAGVRVRLYQDGVGYLTHLADTAIDGTWSIQGMPAGAYRVSISDPSLAHVTEWWGDTTVRSASTVVEVAETHDQQLAVGLARAATLSGTIASTGSVDVHLFAGDPATTSASQVLRAQSGSFSFRGLAAGTYHVLVKDPTGAAKDLWYPGRTSRAEALPITLSPGQVSTATYRQPAAGTGTVEGAVIDTEGPVAGAVVQVYSQSSGTLLRSGRTDVDGLYRITAVAAGPVRLVFRDPSGGHVTAWDGAGGEVVGGLGPHVAPNQTLVLDRELVITSTLQGDVTDGDAAIAGIKVALYRDGAAVRVVSTDADGEWSAGNLEPGTYTVGYSDPSRAFAPEYHGDAAKRADAEPIELEPLHGTEVEAVLAPR